ncbi:MULTISPECIES: VOC family protein [Streptomyces]|uniref:VOC family protein n=1 Tax=Streptomyces lycii TaxID=2654337 RepID=A0ABQ7FP83_9ACTN|nr:MULTISPECIES: VOC family protein [Streptomyces]KAF4410204.1 VOC family protein [Streptomyces lycii]PGH48186.1 glyoxalase/bleomycin resistance/extradiol dioxygenase family protein [Streptomyces sp. Ru87]
MTEPVTRRTPGTPCWVSLMAHSLAATEEFYGALFGWTFAPGPRQLGPYVRAQLGGREVAGMGVLPPGRHLPGSWTTYLASDDADATAEQIRACGGTVAVGPLSAGDAGRLVIASDPYGAVFGVWQGHGLTGAMAAGEPGTQAWNELLTPDVTVVKFYATVFGYETEDAGPELVTLHLEGRPVAAVRMSDEDRAPRWMTYFETDDPDAAARRVTELGGRVLRASGDDPSGRGAATVTDPEGAVFSLLRSAR